MKRILPFLLLAVLLICSASSDAAVQNKRRQTKSAPTQTVRAGEIRTYADGLTTQKFTIKKNVRILSFGSVRKAECSLVIEYPVAGPDEFVEAARKWIKNQVNPDYTGSIGNPKALMLATAKNWSDEQITSEIFIAYSNYNIVTYCNDFYLDGGGAHGIPRQDFATFLLGNGRLLTNADLPPFSKMNVPSKLAKRIGCNRSDLGDNLQEVPTSYPDATPYIVKDGLHVAWGVYEIAPYAMGIIDIELAKSAEEVSGYPVVTYFTDFKAF